MKKSEADRITNVCLDTDLAYEKWLLFNEVCPHPVNRFNSIIDPAHAHWSLKTIADDRWSWHEVDGKARAIERCPGEDKELLQKVIKAISQSGGSLMPIKEHHIKAFAVGATHTSAILWAAEQGAP